MQATWHQASYRRLAAFFIRPMEDNKRIYGPMEACEAYWESLPDQFYWDGECDRSVINELVKWRKRSGASRKKIAELAGFELADFIKIEKWQRKITRGEALRIDNALIDYRNYHTTRYGRIRWKLHFVNLALQRQWRLFSRHLPDIIVILIAYILLFLKTFVYPGLEYNPLFQFGKLLDWGSSFALPMGVCICGGHWLYRLWVGKE